MLRATNRGTQEGLPGDWYRGSGGLRFARPEEFEDLELALQTKLLEDDVHVVLHRLRLQVESLRHLLVV